MHIFYHIYYKIGNIRKWLCYIFKQIGRDLKLSYCYYLNIVTLLTIQL